MSANSVLPPFGLTTRADSSEYFAGIGRNELSECHRQLPRLNRCTRLSRGSGLPSLPRLGTSLRPVVSPASPSLAPVPPRPPSRSPNLRAQPTSSPPCSSLLAHPPPPSSPS